MGPQKSLSLMAEEVRMQTAEVRAFVHRLREANRRMTGSTGEQPTPISGANVKIEAEDPNRRPLLVEMTVALESLNSATADLRAEVGYLENVSETGAEVTGLASQGIGASAARY